MAYTVFYVILPLLIAVSWYLYIELKRTRFAQNASLPQPPPTLLLGHLKSIGEFMSKGDRRRHIGELYNDFAGRIIHNLLQTIFSVISGSP